MSIEKIIIPSALAVLAGANIQTTHIFQSQIQVPISNNIVEVDKIKCKN
ncbi:MAG: hypothetical protein JXL97_08715 [Bacteroidales bacterium]|nr:hypothetical protein [Bacteroidales bacterium]